MSNPILETELTALCVQPLGGQTPVPLPVHPIPLSVVQDAIASGTTSVHAQILHVQSVVVVLNVLELGYFEYLQRRIATVVSLRSFFATAARVATVGSVAAVSVAALATGGVFHGGGSNILEIVAGIAGGLLLLVATYAFWQKEEHKKEEALARKELDKMRFEGKAAAKTQRQVQEEARAEHLETNLEKTRDQITTVMATTLLVATFFSLLFLGTHTKLNLGLEVVFLGAAAGACEYARKLHPVSNQRDKDALLTSMNKVGGGVDSRNAA